MEYKITGYQPEKLFHYFEEISAIPRGSGNEKGISDYLVAFAKDHNLDVYQDEVYNVIIKKPASAGAEAAAPVMMQGHIDMVCDKLASVEHDFEKDGLDLIVKDGVLTANGTTLGADNGIAVALMMTVLDDDALAHPALECVFTTDEETGLVGAETLDKSKIDARIMINLDSEEEGVATVSCAGGVVATLTRSITREHMQDLPSFYEEVIDQRFGGDIDAYVDYLYDHSLFTSGERVAGLIDDYAPAKIAEDPAVELAVSVMKKYFELAAAYREKHASYAEGERKYIAGLMLQQPRKAWAPDANFTIRLTYGQVLPYSPADGIEYNYYTTLKGVMEKEDPENPAEFTVPERLKELYAARDFGRYANERGEMPVAFLANCDITGGNSGSPVMNGRGELIGLAFDGNWEAMSGDVTFEPELQRTIAVDIRYVLFIVDKFAGAGWLLDELDIVQK